MILYLDTSALLKLYVREEHSQVVDSAVEAATVVALSVVAYPEARSAFARKFREAVLTRAEHDDIVRRFDLEWPGLTRYEVTHDIASRAGEVALQLALRSLDAVHLATAIWLNDLNIEPVHFLSFDARLMDAARQVMPVYEWVDQEGI